MSEGDDVFDLDDFIEEHSKPGDSIRKTWKKHRDWLGECESAYVSFQSLKDALRTIKKELERYE